MGGVSGEGGKRTLGSDTQPGTPNQSNSATELKKCEKMSKKMHPKINTKICTEKVRKICENGIQNGVKNDDFLMFF